MRAYIYHYDFISAAKEAESRHSTETNVSNDVPSGADRTSSTQNLESENQRKVFVKSSFLPLSASLSATLVPTGGHSTENGEVDEDVSPDEEFPEITPVSVSTMELVRSPNKRRMAPRPPEEDLPVSSLFARNPGANLKSDSPVVREKEKRERSSSCSPKFRKAVCDAPDPTNSTNKRSVESTPRRTISLSQDSLTTEKEVRGEKKRGRNRKGFSLKRFLRMGSRKDMDMMTGQTSGAKTDEIPSTPQPKPRLEIIHPLELDGAAVEVVGSDRVTAKIGEDQTDSCGGAKNDGSKMTRFPSSSTGKFAPQLIKYPMKLRIKIFVKLRLLLQRGLENHLRRRETSPWKIGPRRIRRINRSDRRRRARSSS